MSKLRKNEPQLKAVFVFPSDEGIDLKATAEKMMENKRCVDFLKAMTGLSNEEALKQEFIDQQSRVAIYSCYAFCKYDPDLLVANEIGILKYVFNTINVKDLDILGDNYEKLKALMEQASMKEASPKELGEALLGMVKDKALSGMITDLISSVMDAKLVKVIGVDDALSKEEAIKETVENLQIEDLKALWYFAKALIALNVEKKKVLVP